MTTALTILVIAVAIVVLLFIRSAHEIPEGHVGVYFRSGALLPEIRDPGLNFMVPIVTRVVPVQTTIQTDSVNDIPCGTSGGVVITFDKVEVVNRLKKAFVHETVQNYTVHYDQTWIFDKIHHEINQVLLYLDVND
jgi:erlin